MKVIHYCKNFSPLSETFIYDVILELYNESVGTEVITNKILNRKERPFANVTEIKLSLGSKLKKGVLKFLDFLNIYQYDGYKVNLRLKKKILKKYLLYKKPDVVHAHYGSVGYEILSATKSLNIPLVVSFHGSDAFQLPKDPEWKYRIQKVFQNASHITVVSNLMKNHLKEIGCPSEKISVIHVGKKLEDYPYSNKDIKSVNNFISIGRLAEKKGHEDCISAFAKISKVNSNIRLKIIGEGERKSRLQELIQEYALEEKVQLLGGLSHNQVKMHLKESDAFILCSKTAASGDMEGIPTVLMEAQALGLPCISTKHSGIPEVIPLDSQFLLAEEGDVNSISTCIGKLLNMNERDIKHMTHLGRKKIEREFNLEIEVNKLIEIYKILSKH